MSLEMGKIVRPQSPTKACCIDPQDKSHIGLILSETKVTDKSGEVFLNVRTNEIVCALSSKTVYLSNNGQVISNIDLPYYWCNFCTFKTEEKQQLLSHLMEHRFSCHFCVFQTFSRVDVVRHTVQEHKQFDGADLKFCILLPDLLKHGLRQGEDHPGEKPVAEKPAVEKVTPPKEDAKKSKRKRKESSSEEEEEEEESNKRSQAAVKAPKTRGTGSARRGRAFSGRFLKSAVVAEEKSSSNSSSSEEDTAPMTRRSTRASFKADVTAKRDKTPGVCFECSVCAFRTFKKATLLTHTAQSHNGAKPRFALKIVSQSQAKEIEEKDGKSKPTEKSSPKSASNREAAEEVSKMDEDVDTNTPEVEIDYAEDYDYSALEAMYDDDDDDDKDFVPSGGGRKKKIAMEKKKQSIMKTPDPPILKIEQVVSQQVTFRCLLCNKFTNHDPHVMKQHYMQTHPGGTLVWSQSMPDSFKDQWMYFCATDSCSFMSANPLSWLEHCKTCQKDALEFPDPTNMLHTSIINTANTVKENMVLIRQALNATEGEGNSETQTTTPGQLGGQSAVRIKTESPPEDSELMYNVYNNDPDPVMNVPVSSYNSSSPNKAFPVAMTPNIAVIPPVPPVTPEVLPIQRSAFPMPSQLQAPLGTIPSSTPAPANAPVVSAILNGPRMSQPVQPPSNAVVNMLMIKKLNSQLMEGSKAGDNSKTALSNHDGKSSSVAKGGKGSNQSQMPAKSGKPKPATSPDKSSSSTPSSNVSTRSSFKPQTSSSPSVVSSAPPVSAATTSNIKPPAPKPVVNQPASKPVVDQPASKPVVNQPAMKPIAAHPYAKPKSKAPPPTENVPFDSSKKGSYKCAHCRFLANKVMEIRDHMIDRHGSNPLYSLDMAAEENNVPRFLMFCPKEGCKFCTKGKDLFLKHMDECAAVETNGKKHTEDYTKRVQVTRNFAAKTLEKLQSLTQ